MAPTLEIFRTMPTLPKDDSPERLLGIDLGSCGFTPEQIAGAPPPPDFVDPLAIDLEESEEWKVLLGGDPSAAPVPIPAPFRHLRRKLHPYHIAIHYVDGWRTRGRPGIFLPRGIMEHHTASAATSGPHPALGIVTAGRSDLPGPLSNFLIGRNADVYMVAAGRCNHAGVGGPLKGIPEDSGNAYLVGIECENNGIGEEWSPEMRRTMAILDVILLEAMGAPARMVLAHKEWTDRKIDPSIRMRPFRHRVRRLLNERRD